MDLFNMIKIPKLKRNVFDLSHEVKLTCNMGELVPIMCEEVVPGDTFKLNSEMMMRFMPMLSLVMHRVDVYTHYFFVPNRLVWDEWEDFITGGEDGTAAPIFPKIVMPMNRTNELCAPGSLMDYLGFPTWNGESDNLNGIGMVCNALPFRAYQLIYNEYYRDQNVTDEVVFSKGSGLFSYGGEVIRLSQMRRRAWEKDYFTSALPWTQRGEDVSLPIDVNVNLAAASDGAFVPAWANPGPLSRSDSQYWRKKNTDGTMGDVVSPNELKTLQVRAGVSTIEELQEDGSYKEVVVELDPNGTTGVYAREAVDSMRVESTSVSATINEMRRAIALQRWLERNARGGSRYVEQILSHFGVKSSDARLQRPEYLGGGKTPVQFSEVLQTSQTSTSEVDGTSIVSAQGNMAGHGLSVGSTHSFKKFFEEHGFIIGIMSIRPRSGYFQGLPKKYFKYDKLDYYFPEFAHLGEQEVKEAEVFYHLHAAGPNTGDAASENERTFGYQSRYAEYKYLPDRVHGDFRTNLDYWHLARRFSESAPPRLNTAFMEVPNNERIFALEDDGATDKVIVQIYHNLRAVRPMPKFGTPSL